jgi:hypothetical protein
MWIPLVAFAADRTYRVTAKLRQELGREPEDHEVRAAMGLGPILGETEVPAYYLSGLGGCVVIGGYAIHFDPERDGKVKFKLVGAAPTLDVDLKLDAGTVADLP